MIDLREPVPVRIPVAAVFVVLGALLALFAPLFAVTYTQADMGLLVIIMVTPALWVVGLVFACFAVARSIARWHRVLGIVVLAALAAELLTVTVGILVNVLSR